MTAPARDLRAGPRRSTVTVAAEDGCPLATDVWLPADDDGPWPTLLQRLPYGRAVASAAVLPSPAALAALGHAVVVQDVRGTGHSGGSFVPFAEGTDGAVTVEWAAAQPFSTGDVCLYGFSYQGYDQLRTASLRPRGLRGIAPMMCPAEPYEFLHDDGLRKWDFYAGWAAQLARLGGDPRPADPGAPVPDALGADPPAWYRDWAGHPERDDYWAALAADLGQIDVPVLTVIGYGDLFAAGTWRLATTTGAHAVCGPWAHMPWGTRHGGLELGPAAGPRPATEAFLTFLADVFAGVPVSLPRVTWYEVGGTWHSAQAWPPPAAAVTLHATSGLLGANSRHGDGRLGPEPADRPLSDVIVHEPGSPVPGTSDPFTDLAAVEDRRDVLCYTGAPLGAATRVVGTPRACLTVTAPGSTVDLVASLVTVDGGESRELAHGGRRVTVVPGEPTDIELTLGPVGWVLQPGTAVRLDICASRFPRFDRDPGAPVASVLLSAARLEMPVAQEET